MISDINIRVDRDKCTACGLCVDRCIMDNLRLSIAPCRTACPLHINCQGYIRMIAQGKEKEAAKELSVYSPFGAILGRVCSRKCEAVCERSKIDGAVHIRALKRYLCDTYPDIALKIPATAPETKHRAAIVGSGPAGLMAACELRKKGHAVTVYESESEPGGLLRYGIPSFRLPVEEVKRTVDILEQMGIEFVTSSTIGENIEFSNLTREYDALILAFGAGSKNDLQLPGIDEGKVINGLHFLKQSKLGQLPALGKTVVVIGRGYIASGVATTCRRMGVDKVTVTCQADFSKMSDMGLTADHVVLATNPVFEAPGIPEDFLNPNTGYLAGDDLTCQTPVERKIFVCGDAFSGRSSVIKAMASGYESAISVDRFLGDKSLTWERDFWSARGIVKEYQCNHNRAQGGSRSKLSQLPPSKPDLEYETERVILSEEALEQAKRCLSCGRSFEMNKTCWFCLPCEIVCPVQALEVRMPYQVR